MRNSKVARRSALVRDLTGLALAFWVFTKQFIQDIGDGFSNVHMVSADIGMLFLAELFIMAFAIEFLALVLAARAERKAAGEANEA